MEMVYHSPIDTMNYRHHVHVDQNSLPKIAYEELCAIAPSARKHYGFHLQLDTNAADGGEVVRRITAICSQHGLRRRQAVGKGAYKHTVDRDYQDDLFHFDFLMLNPQTMTRAGVRDGRFVGAADPEYMLMSELGFSQRVVVSEDVREVIEKGEFVGLEFGASPLFPESVGGVSAEEWLAGLRSSQRWAVLPGPFWELKSSVILPKMASSLMQYGWRGEPPRAFEGDYSRPVFIDDPPFSKGEVHYRRHQIAALGSFDVARTYENYMAPKPALVISQRFYQRCLANGIGIWADPVHIDPE
jgi:hypothetical protein